jgi:hypothetical protein
LVAVHLEKRILDILQLRINDLGSWFTIFSEQLTEKLPVSPEIPADSVGHENAFLQTDPESLEAKDGLRSSLDGGFQDDQSDHGTDQSTAYGEELRHQAEGSPSVPGVHAQRGYQFQPKIAKPTGASVLVFVQTGRE